MNIYDYSKVQYVFSPKSKTENNLAVGDRVIVSSGMGSRPGVLQYIGETKFAPGNWCGVQLDEPSGKNDGSVDGVKYLNFKHLVYRVTHLTYNVTF